MIVRASLNALRKMRNGFHANIHAGMTGIRKLNRNRLGNNLVALDRLVAVDDLMIGRQQQLNAFSFRPLLDLQRGLASFRFRPATCRP